MLKVVRLSAGSPRREFLRGDDLADAALFCLEHWRPGRDDLQSLNVGTGTDLTIAEVAGLVAEAVGYRGAIRWDAERPDGTPRQLLDVGRLAALGWRARIPLRQGLADSVAGYIAGPQSGSEVRL